MQKGDFSRTRGPSLSKNKTQHHMCLRRADQNPPLFPALAPTITVLPFSNRAMDRGKTNSNYMHSKGRGRFANKRKRVVGLRGCVPSTRITAHTMPTTNVPSASVIFPFGKQMFGRPQQNKNRLNTQSTGCIPLLLFRPALFICKYAIRRAYLRCVTCCCDKEAPNRGESHCWRCSCCF